MLHGTHTSLFVVLCAVAIGCGGTSHPAAATATAGARVERSNILRADYAGSARCQPCHAAIYDRWSRSPMHRMTRSIGTAEVRAPFDHAPVFRIGTDSATISQVEDRRYILLSVAGRPDALYRITRVIGGRYREDYAALPVESTDRGAAVIGDPRAEMIMPVSWVYSTQSWRYKGYSVMVNERPGMRAGPEWLTSCVFCHNTTPFLASTYDALLGPDAPVYQAQLRGNLLPPERQWRFEVTNQGGLHDALATEIERVRGRAFESSALPMPELLRRAIGVTVASFDSTHLVETGVGCESCHNGAREHADGGALPSFEVRSAFMREVPAHPGATPPTEAEWINRTCARCHTVLFSHYPYTWEGGLRHSATPGGSHINSGEARDFLMGGCATRMSCTTCHDPHTEDTAASLARFETTAGNQVCLDCHSRYRGEEALRAHAHHDPAGAGGVCINCHMPQKNMGLNYNLTRYHRVGSPTESVRVEHDRPLECALCHADRSVNSLLGSMEQWWGHTYDRDALHALYGNDLDVNVLTATLARGRAHEQAVAIGVLGRDRVTAALPMLVEQMSNQYPLVRYFALHAIGNVTGTLPDWDMNADGATLRTTAEAWLRSRGAGQGVR